MSDETERLPPNSRECERCVLGSMLRCNAVIDDVMIMTAEDFYTDAHQKIAALMFARWAKGGPVDVMLLADDLKAMNKIEDIGGYGYLGELWDASPTAANAEYYARIVRDKAMARSLINAGQTITRDGYDPSGSSEDMVAKAESTIFAIAEHRPSESNAVEISEAVGLVYDEIDERARNRGIQGVPSGFDGIDQITSGFKPGSLTYVGARPSVGKTSFASALAIGAARGDKPSLFISLEQRTSELVERMICAEGEINSHKVRLGDITDFDVGHIRSAGDRLRQLKVFIDDAPHQTVQRISATARRFRRRHGIEVVFIDYLQLIIPENRKSPREEQVAQISRRLKLLARELNVPVICLAQLNREAEKRPGHVPILSDLRESGSIEQDADLVMLLHRPELYGDRPGEVDVIVAKQRNGQIGVVTLAFAKQFMRFDNRTDRAQHSFGGVL